MGLESGQQGGERLIAPNEVRCGRLAGFKSDQEVGRSVELCRLDEWSDFDFLVEFGAQAAVVLAVVQCRGSEDLSRHSLVAFDDPVIHLVVGGQKPAK